MRNPLVKRLPKELKSEFGKYFVLFVFIAGMIGIVSGFLVAGGSMETAYNESFEKYNIESGNFEYDEEADKDTIKKLEKEDVKIYKNFYKEEETKEVDSTLRIFNQDFREDMDKICLMSGELPKKEKEIAIDRMYADNNNIEVGDTLTVAGKKLEVTGLVALSDYSALFSSTSDMMFDAVKFGVAVMTGEGFDSIRDSHIHYSYSWIYDDKPKDKKEAKEKSEDFLEVLAENGILKNYIPEYSNQAIHFTGDDISGDKNMIAVFLYIVLVIIAFIFGITTNNTIVKESCVIGTLRASGYTKGELIRHYLTMPIFITLLAAGVGNVLGYTTIKDIAADMYYASYSLPTYVTLWNADAFIKTTIIPVIIMFAINIITLVDKLNISPLKFIRRDLSKKKKKKAFRLNTKIPILKRFRLRVIFQNIPNYITIFVGVFFASVILLFGMAMKPLLDNYQDLITDNMVCKYQYILKAPVETKEESAEKYIATSLNTVDDKIKVEPATVYGINEKSDYIDIDVSDLRKNQVYISNAYAEKYDIEVGDKVTMKEEYGDKEYTFKVKGVYYYPSAVAVFMSEDKFKKTFDKEDYFNGYFSDEELDDIDEAYISTKVTVDDMTKVSRQLKVSMGEMMSMFLVFGIVMFMLVIYMLSKIVIEKNSQSISMTKILGYSNSEISSLYINSTTIVVILSLLISIPLVNLVMKKIFRIVFMEYSGWLPYYVSYSIFIKIFLMGILAYAVIAFLQVRKIKKIPMDEALKNVE